MLDMGGRGLHAIGIGRRKGASGRRHKCLSELIQRGIVQVGERGSTGKIKTCRIHDIIHEFCLAKSKDINFLQVVGSLDKNMEMESLFWGSKSMSSQGQFRRVAVHFLRDEILPLFEKIRDNHLRSLMVFNLRVELNQHMMATMFNKFRLLRILKFEKIFMLEGCPLK